MKLALLLFSFFSFGGNFNDDISKRIDNNARAGVKQTPFLLQMCGPVAVAGPNQVHPYGYPSALLDGTGSFSLCSSIVSYEWQQVYGSAVSIKNPNSAITFVDLLTIGNFVFKLTVIDNNGDEATATIVVSNI